MIEDDYDSEFRFTERPLETLHSMDDAGRVLYLGTFSKSLVPGLRFGYLVAPEPLQDALRAALQLSVGYVDVPVQAALARFLEDGLFARHLRKARAAYAERRTLVLEAVHGPLGDHLELVPCQAGLHVTTLLRDQSVDDAAVVARRRRAGRGGRGAVAVRRDRPAARDRDGLRRRRHRSITPGLARLAAVLGAIAVHATAPAPMSAGPEQVGAGEREQPERGHEADRRRRGVPSRAGSSRIAAAVPTA